MNNSLLHASDIVKTTASETNLAVVSDAKLAGGEGNTGNSSPETKGFTSTTDIDYSVLELDNNNKNSFTNRPLFTLWDSSPVIFFVQERSSSASSNCMRLCILRIRASERATLEITSTSKLMITSFCVNCRHVLQICQIRWLGCFDCVERLSKSVLCTNF